MSSTIIIVLKIIYVSTLLSLFIYYFGLQSFIMYSEHRVMFTDEMIEFRQDKPPAILIAHAPVEPRNYDIIGSCLEDSRNYGEKEYGEMVKCIDKNLTNKTIIFEDWSNETKEYLNFEKVQLGIIISILSKSLMFCFRFMGTRI